MEAAIFRHCTIYRSVHGCGSDHEKLFIFNDPTILSHIDAPVTDKDAILHILQCRISDQESMRTRLSHIHVISLKVSGCQRFNKQRYHDFTRVPNGNSRHIGIHVEDFLDLGRLLDHAGIA